MRWKSVALLCIAGFAAGCTPDPVGPATSAGPDLAGPAYAYVGTPPSSFNNTWFQGFEVDAIDWSFTQRVPSGTNGVASSSGAFHGEATSGATTRFNAYSAIWPGNYVTEVDVYLDPAWAVGQGFDYSVASSSSTGIHLRDFIFHIGVTPLNGLRVLADNNTYGGGAPNAFVLNGAGSVQITSAGWYKLQHIFYDDGGVLAVDMQLLNSSGSVLYTTTRKDLTDVMANVGGNRYGWYIFSTRTLAFDNQRRATAGPQAPSTTALTITPAAPVFDANNAVGVPADAAPGFSSGSFASDGTGKTDIYLTPEALFAGREISVGQVARMSYWTKTGATHVANPADWYMTIYTKPYAGQFGANWYGSRFGAEPYFSANLVDPANTWNQWSTNLAPNRLRFFESTAGAPLASFGSYTDPNWADFINASSLGTTVRRASQPIRYFSIQTGSAWADGFTGQLDGLRIELTDGSVATVNFEPECTTICYVNGTTGDNSNSGATPATAKKTIQAAVTQVSVGGTVIVAPGTYAENVTIAKNLSLTSSGGRNVTTIDGLAGGNTITVTNNTTALIIGGAGKGFTIVGKDTPNPAIEQAAVYFQGSHSGATVRDNNIVAGGEAGLMTEFSATIAGFTITGNEFSGKTFVGANPAGDGFGSQFSLHNVPRQLVVISGGSGGGNTSNITFTNNVVSGTAGGTNDANAPQGNNLVTIDANVATISGNDFTGFTNRFAHSLRARGPGAAITKNRFIAGSPVGVFIGAAAAPTSSVTRNAIVGNAAGIFVEAASASPLAATCNWYGSPSGPTNAANPSGTGDPVVGPATFTPWLVSSNLDGACIGGPGPVVSNVAVTPNPAPFTTASYTLTATATDNVAVTSASYTIDGGAPVAFTFVPGASVSLSASIGALAVGVYNICVTAKDAVPNTSNTECTMLAVYDPTAGFVTGGGWFMSPAGAYAADLALTGKASFGFVSKYLKGATTPTGDTEFQFHTGALNFSSTSYEWLVVNQNGTNAQFKGVGSLNGVPGYKFMTWAKDGTPDTFRIKITTASDVVVYDNQQDGEFGTPLSGGSIVIHVPKK